MRSEVTACAQAFPFLTVGFLATCFFFVVFLDLIGGDFFVVAFLPTFLVFFP